MRRASFRHSPAGSNGGCCGTRTGQEAGPAAVGRTTNHLDIESIDWLEQFLPRLRRALLFVTHDRTFCRSWLPVSSSWTAAVSVTGPAIMPIFYAAREEALNAEEKANERFDKRLAEEEVDSPGYKSKAHAK